MKDARFDAALNPIKLSAWLCLKSVIGNFLGNHRSPEYEKTVDGEFPHVSKNALPPSHLDYFSNFSEEQGERFHKDIRWDVNFLADYCWCLKRDVVSAWHNRKSVKRPIIPE
ncbi:hypothetical protein Pcinc_000232 [Petrolisthes cinctipes]|uniref:Uncharacterized protein n=1 Tax=Petrolisthes cinctipes TaxID=88211 RepID=A0AAE1GPT7_PETCI|nr:hypothetical protein Pcinc_000232 [Petrolisthes cinctipes]